MDGCVAVRASTACRTASVATQHLQVAVASISLLTWQVPPPSATYRHFDPRIAPSSQGQLLPVLRSVRHRPIPLFIFSSYTHGALLPQTHQHTWDAHHYILHPPRHTLCINQQIATIKALLANQPGFTGPDAGGTPVLRGIAKNDPTQMSPQYVSSPLLLVVYSILEETGN